VPQRARSQCDSSCNSAGARTNRVVAEMPKRPVSLHRVFTAQAFANAPVLADCNQARQHDGPFPVRTFFAGARTKRPGCAMDQTLRGSPPLTPHEYWISG
jgi:hypothetical protein